MDGEADRVSQATIELCHEIAEHSRDFDRVVRSMVFPPEKRPVCVVLFAMYSRASSAIACLQVLAQSDHRNPSWDFGTFFRALFDLHLQAKHLLQLPDERAMDYLEYRWVEKHKSLVQCLNQKGQLAEALQQSSNRPANEARTREEFKRVKPRFTDLNKKNKPELRRHWYKGDLRTLAQEFDLDQEYEFLCAPMNAVIHSSPLGILGPQLKAETLFLACMLLYARLIFDIGTSLHVPMPIAAAKRIRELASERLP